MIFCNLSDKYRNLSLSLITLNMRSDKDNRDWQVFFGVPEAFEDMLTSRTDLFLPLAVFFGLLRNEPVDLSEMNVDPYFFRNALAAAKQHQSWHSRLQLFPPEGVVMDDRRRISSEASACFYSGGVDSLFTLFRHTKGNSQNVDAVIDQDLDYALHIFHSRGPISPSEIEIELLVLNTGAQIRDVVFVPVFSNVMTFDDDWKDAYGLVTHGVCLATVLHALAGRIGRGLIGSSDTYGELIPWGSSPITDHLYSSSDLEVIHDGSTYTRVEKTKFISQSSEALSLVNVCDRLEVEFGYLNCSECQKCLRTMVTIDLAGKANAEDCPNFDWTNYSPEKLASVFLHDQGEALKVEEIVAASAGVREDIRLAGEKALRQSKYLRPLANFEKALKSTAFGRKNHQALKRIRRQVYRAIGVKH